LLARQANLVYFCAPNEDKTVIFGLNNIPANNTACVAGIIVSSCDSKTTTKKPTA